MNPLVSVIIPVYNAEKFIAETIKSVLNQTYKDFELILVDDGATDGSGEICDSFSKLDTRIRVIHVENGGTCRARNIGMKNAKGKYIGFCDHDDEMLPKCLEVAVRAAEEGEADVVRFSRWQKIIQGDKEIADYTVVSDALIRVEDWESYLSVVNSTAYGVWAGLYRKAFLVNHNLNFDEKIRYGYEDVLFISDCCSQAKQIILISDILYIWKIRASSSNSRRNGQMIFENRFAALLLWRDLEDRIGNQFHRTKIQAETRRLEYLKRLMEEVSRLNIKANEKRSLFSTKKKILLAGQKVRVAKGTSLKDLIKFIIIYFDSVGIYDAIHKGQERTRLRQILDKDDRANK